MDRKNSTSRVLYRARIPRPLESWGVSPADKGDRAAVLPTAEVRESPRDVLFYFMYHMYMWRTPYSAYIKACGLLFITFTSSLNNFQDF